MASGQCDAKIAAVDACIAEKKRKYSNLPQ
jgi:hypothetical protein